MFTLKKTLGVVSFAAVSALSAVAAVPAMAAPAVDQATSILAYVPATQPFMVVVGPTGTVPEPFKWEDLGGGTH